MWIPICGYMDAVERNKTARDILRKQFLDEFIESQLTGDITKLEHIKAQWKKLDDEENSYLILGGLKV